ncbi:MAG TPA: NF038122 family metalloprotease [Phenylobacterium sp.]|nr:NF038122 family metalloprotease [Phenylobacterium sp.]
MSLPAEAVSQVGSGLVFINYYGDSVSDAFRNAILSAEHQLQSLFVDATTVGVHFDLAPLGQTFSAQNSYVATTVSYDAFVASLRAHATSADDFTALAGLPVTDPSGGRGFQIPTAEARILGLAVQTNNSDIHVELNDRLPFSFGQDAIGALEHEITEGVFGRVGGLGFDGPWRPLDLFRFTQAGVRDYTGGSDGVPTFFGIDAAHVTSFQYHASIDATGTDDGFDLGDWDHTRGDAFGPGGPNSPGSLSDTDLQVLDVLGWTRAGMGRAFTPAPDDFASSLTDTARPFGHVAAGGSATGVLEQAGDRDWFAVTFEAGKTYTIDLSGHSGGGGTVADTYVRLHDASGALLASNDDIVDGDQPDSRVVFTAITGGTYYVEAGAFVDGYTGTYKVSVSAGGGASTPTDLDDVLTARAGGDTIHGLGGNDTITGADGANYLRGDDGNDLISGGAGFDDINGNQGNDTLHGAGGDDWVVGGKDNDLQYGEDGADVVLGNLGDDTLSGGAGDDIVRGGQGNDLVSGGSGNDYVSGDRGDDTESGGSGADIFHSFGDAGLDRVVDFSSAEGDRVMLDPGSAWTAAQVGADTVVSLTGGAQMVLVGVTLSSLPDGWIFVG